MHDEPEDRFLTVVSALWWTLVAFGTVLAFVLIWRCV